MIERKHIAAVKAAQNEAGLDDAAYRKLLRRFGVYSCKELEPDQVADVIRMIRSEAVHRKGWQLKQIRKFRQYAGFCGMNDNDARMFLYDQFRIPHEESPFLKQQHFDDIMLELESELEYRIREGLVPRPERIDLCYWRNRHPDTGKMNSREQHLLAELWNELSAYLPEEKKSDSYLLGMAAKACNRPVCAVTELSSVEALNIIEALKNRLKSEKNRLLEEVPF